MDKNISSNVLQTISSESVSFLTQAGAADAGEAAGTIVLGQLAYDKVLNLPGSDIGLKAGNSISSSLVFTTGVMDSTLEVAWDYSKNGTNAQITNMIAVLGGAGYANGSWSLDYFTGLLVVKKKTTGTSQVITSYKVRSASGSGGSSSITSIIPGTGATNLGKAEDAATASGDTGVAILERRIDTLASSAGTDGDYAFKNQDSLGASYGREVYAATAEDNTVGVFKVEERFSYSNITTATTTTVKSGAGFVHAITVNTTAAGTITIYDNTAGSGTKIGTLKASIGEQTFIFNVTFGTGLTIVTAAASDITVSYR